METISTVCSRDCYDTCALTARVRASGAIDSIKADPLNPVTRTFTCPRGARDIQRLSLNRIQAPCVRKQTGLEAVSWDEAIDTIARKLENTLADHGPESVLYLEYAGNMGALTTAFPRRLWNAIGATQTDMALCSKSGKTALRLHYGNAYGLQPMELPSKDLIIFWGFNARVSAPHLWSLALGARRDRNARIIVIDPRRSESAKGADLWVQPRPGTDVALAYGVMKYLVDHQLTDTTFIRDHTTGFDRLKQEMDQWPRDAACRVTGVARDTFDQLAGLYGQQKNSATLIGIGLQKCDQGADQVRAVSFVPALLGMHRGFFYSNGDSFYIDESLISGETLKDISHKKVAQVGLGRLLKQGQFKFVYVNCINPALTIPDQTAFRQGLERSDLFMAVHETHWTGTARLAHAVLPAPAFLEKTDVVIPWGHPYIRKSNPVTLPRTDSRTEVDVMQCIARKLGLEHPWLYEDPWTVLEKAFEHAFENGTFRELLDNRLLTLKTKPDHFYDTPSGKIEFYASPAAGQGFSPLPVQEPTEIPEKDFILLNSADSRYTSTQFQEVFGDIPSRVVMNPGNARRLNIGEDTEIILENELGTVRVTVSLSETVPENILWTPRQATDLTGAPMNCLMSGTPQKIGGGARYNSTRVTARPALKGAKP